MARGKAKYGKKRSSSVAVNNNIVPSKQDYDASGNTKTEKCEIGNCDEPSQEQSNMGSSIPPICQEFLDVVSGMGLQIVTGQQLESQNSRKNEKQITQRDQNQWSKSSRVLSSKSNKAQLTDKQQNSNFFKLIQPMPVIIKEWKPEEERKKEFFSGKSMSSESMRAACYKKPPGTPRYSSHRQLSGRSFLSSKSEEMKIKETKVTQQVKESNELKGDKKEQNDKQNKNITLTEIRLQDSTSEVNSVDAATHDTSWNIDKYKSEHDPTLRWHFKKRFLENNKEKYPEEELVSLAEEELVSLAEVFCNTLFLGCTYSRETTQLVQQLEADLAAEYKEMKHLNCIEEYKEMKHLNCIANPPSAAPQPEIQPFYCTDIRYRKSTDKVVSQSFINQGSKSSIKQVYHNKCIKQESQSTGKKLSHSSAKQKSQSSNNQVYHCSVKQSPNQVSRSSSKQGLVTHQTINYEKIVNVKSIEELEPAIVDAAYDVLKSSRPTFSLRSSELHEGVLRAVGHVPYFTKVRLHDTLKKHPSSFKIGSRPFKVDKNPTISLVWSEKKTSDDRDTDPSFYAGCSKPSFVNYHENSVEFEDDDDPDVLYSKEESILTLDSEIKAPKAAHETIVTLTESDSEEALKENVDNIDWVDLIEERDHDQLNEFSEKVLSVLNKLTSVQKLPVNESQDKLDQCAGLILGLAVDDQTLTESCADLCKSLETVKAAKEGRVGEFLNFRRLLLLKLQSQFENHSNIT